MTNDTLQNKKRVVRILLVEDNRGDALLVKRAFEDKELENHITIASTGEEALNLLHKIQDEVTMPDIILLDLNLPGISGLEVLKKIKNEANLKRIPIIILSSSRAENDVLNCYDNHASCYMKKAYSMDELYALTDKIEQFWFTQVILPDEKNIKEDTKFHPE